MPALRTRLALYILSAPDMLFSNVEFVARAVQTLPAADWPREKTHEIRAYDALAARPCYRVHGVN